MAIDPKAFFISTHDELIDEYMEENPEATEDEAAEATAEEANDKTGEMLAEYGDWQRQQNKDRQMEEDHD